MVNNLCCDHNCLAKVFKRHTSQKKTEVIESYSKLLKKIVPELQDTVIRGHMSNMVEIEAQ